MKDILVLIIEKEKRNRPSQIIVNNEVMVSPEKTEREIYDFSLSGGVKKINVENLSRNMDANLVVILDEDTYVPEDFINRVISFNNLFRDAGIFCGPVYPNVESRFSKSYYTYDLNFSSSVVSDITGEVNCLPSLIGCVLTRNALSQFQYSHTSSPRHTSADNSCFIMNVASKYKIYYSNKLSKARYLDKSDFELEKLSSYYYSLGYQDGLALSTKTIKEKHMELFDRFVNSPEMFDNTMPRWLFASTPEKDGEYAEMLVLAKCKYQIGFYEGMIGKRVI